jgi:flagellar biosynthetic protein FliO
MIDLDTMLRFALALGAVLALILALGWIARKRLAGPMGAAPEGRRLRIVEVAPIDPRAKLLLVRCGTREHLVAVGPGGITRIDTLDAAPDSDGTR